MGSAFTPVQPRRPSPMMGGGVIKPSGGLGGSGRSRSKRTRQTSSLAHMTLVEEECDIDLEERTAETAPDNLSTSASEASSKGSNGSQPQLLDFIGQTCMASAWFTSCFPCAVVDINDSDDYVVDKLSRESAMNVMYAKNNFAASPSVTPDGSPARGGHSRSSMGGGVVSGGEDKNLMFVQLPNDSQEDLDTMVTNDELPHLHSIPSVIQEEEDESDGMDEISLNDDAGSMPLTVCVTPERLDSGIVDYSVPAADERQVNSPPKKKRFGMKKLFSRKKV